MAFGITDAGFVRKDYDTILTDLEASVRANVDPDLDLSGTQPDGQWLRVMAKALDELWQVAEDSYNAAWLDTAAGVSLDRVAELKGSIRQDEVKAVVTLEFAGDPSTPIPAGTLVATAQEIQFETIEAVTTDGSGDATVEARALVAGYSGLVPANSITTIVTPVAGIDTVDNPSASTDGADIEADPDLRTRLQDQSASSGSSDYGIEAQLQNVAGVTVARVYVNRTLVESVDGIPAKSIECVVEGGTDEDVAETIYRAAPAEVGFEGTTTETITDDGGEVHTIKFSRPVEVEIFVIVNIVSNSAWVSGQDVKVKTAVVKTIGGVDTVGSVSTEYEGLGIGENVRVWQIFGNMDEEGIVGIEELEILVGLTSSPAPAEDKVLAIAARERAITETANVTVNVT